MKTFNIVILLTKILSVFILITVSCMPFQQAKGQESLRIAAVVNDEIISAYDLKSRIQIIMILSRLPVTEENFSSLRSPTLRTLIDELVKLQEATKLGITVTQENIENAMRVVEKRHSITSGNLINVMEEYGADIESLIKQLRAEIAWNRIVTRKYRNVINIDEKEIDRLIATDNAAKNQPKYHISEIVLLAENNAQTGETETQINSIISQLNAGAEFSEIARSFSQSPSASKGGEIGWVRMNQIPEELRPAVSLLRPGQITRPIRLNTGFVIIKLHDIRSGSIPNAVDNKLKLSQFHLALPANAAQETVSSYFAIAKSKTESLNGCESLEAAGKKFGSPLSGSLGEINLLKLPIEIQNIVRSLPVAQVSAPTIIKESILVLMVCERKEPLKNDLTMTREIAKRRLFSERMSIYARQELRDLLRSAYIEIR